MSRSLGAARLPLEEPVVRPSFRRERAALKRGQWPVAGCDEAGRGPLAGPVIGGDGRSASIAAASIVAKVTRDRLMTRLALAHPGYGFERHKGYSVPEHYDALARLGPTIHHRRSFAPVAASIGGAIGPESAEIPSAVLSLD